MSSSTYQSPGLRLVTRYNPKESSLLKWPLSTIAGLFVIFLVSFLNLIDVSIDKSDVGLDKQVIFKLAGVALGGLYGGIGLITDRRVRNIIQSFPVFWMVIVIAMFFVSVPTSKSPVVSMASSVAMVAVLLMTVRALVQIGVMPVLNAVFAGMAMFNIFSWVVFYAWPEVGVLKEGLPDGKFAYRMSGLAHSNTLGQYAGLTVVLGTVLAITYGLRSKIRIGVILVAFGALIGSLSRTSLAATILALFFAYRKVFFRREYIRRYLVAGMLGVVALMVVSTQVDIGSKIKSKMKFLSKSGDVEELTSGTGRAEIWGYTIRLISERPIIGYGAATSKFYLADYSSYTHNMILNVAFSTGIIGGFAMVLMVVGRIVSMTKISHPLADGILIFIIINGLFENVIFSILAGMPTMVWVISLAWPLLDDEMIDTRTGQLKNQSVDQEETLRFSQ